MVSQRQEPAARAELRLIIPVRAWKLPLPNILFFSGVLVERMILSTTFQLSKVLTSPTDSAIISSAAEEKQEYE